MESYGRLHPDWTRYIRRLNQMAVLTLIRCLVGTGLIDGTKLRDIFFSSFIHTDTRRFSFIKRYALLNIYFLYDVSESSQPDQKSRSKKNLSIYARFSAFILMYLGFMKSFWTAIKFFFSSAVLCATYSTSLHSLLFVSCNAHAWFLLPYLASCLILFFFLVDLFLPEEPCVMLSRPINSLFDS